MSKHSHWSVLLLALGWAGCGDPGQDEDSAPGTELNPVTSDASFQTDASVTVWPDAGSSPSASMTDAGAGSLSSPDASGIGAQPDAAAGSDAAKPPTPGLDAGGDAGASDDAGADAASDGSVTNDNGEEPTGDCTSPPAQGDLIGWASEAGGTKGGGDASPTTVTTFGALAAAVAGSAPTTVWIKGSLKGDLTIGSNKTLVGLCGAELHGHVELSESSNVILRNLKIVGYAVGNCSLDPSYNPAEGCSSGQDAISIQKNAHHIWIDHCDISDGTDGNLDITNGANYITVSWTKFHYTPRSDNQGNDSTGAAGHRYSNLVGGTDNPKYDDAHALNVTWHHNFWADNVVERQPRVRFGKNHLFNNLWSSRQSSYCVRAGKQAQILVERSVFDGVKDPQEFNNSSDEKTASITTKDNVYTNTSGSKATGGGGPPFTSPPYAYTPESTQGLAERIRSQVGPR